MLFKFYSILETVDYSYFNTILNTKSNTIYALENFKVNTKGYYNTIYKYYIIVYNNNIPEENEESLKIKDGNGGVLLKLNKMI